MAVTAFSFCVPGKVQAQDMTAVYSPSVLKKDAKRLETAIRKIYNLGIRPHLTASQKRALSQIQFQFPLPRSGDYFLNFYAQPLDSSLAVVMPVLSLKILEDLTTAYAWLYHNGFSLSTIDIYFTMLRHRPQRKFPNGQFPSLLTALGIPNNALKNPKVDSLSLAFRNEAFAFILVHELGHILFRHKGYDEITAIRAQQDEIQSDRFALDILEKSGTPPMGAVFFFQAQFYSMPHRGEFDNDKAWQDFLQKEATHPLTGKRLKDLSRYISGPLANRRAKENAIWRFIGGSLSKVITVLEDMDLQKCLIRVAKDAPLDILRPRKQIAGALINKLCGKARQ